MAGNEKKTRQHRSLVIRPRHGKQKHLQVSDLSRASNRENTVLFEVNKENRAENKIQLSNPVAWVGLNQT